MFFKGSKKFTRHQNFAIEKKDKREKGLNVFFVTRKKRLKRISATKEGHPSSSFLPETLNLSQVLRRSEEKKKKQQKGFILIRF